MESTRRRHRASAYLQIRCTPEEKERVESAVLDLRKRKVSMVPGISSCIRDALEIYLRCLEQMPEWDGDPSNIQIRLSVVKE